MAGWADRQIESQAVKVSVTALMRDIAAIPREPAMCDELLECDADPFIQPSHSPLSNAKKKGERKKVKIETKESCYKGDPTQSTL